MSRVNTPQQVEAMRIGGKMLGTVLAYAAKTIRPGMTGVELDALVAQETKRLDGEAAFLGHEGFPASICISVNEGVVHGIPRKTEFKEGDVVGLDFGIRHDGMVTDAAITVAVGEVGKDAQRLLKITEEALYAGIDQATSGNRVGDISAAIERHLRTGNLAIIRELVGHGVGETLWEDPIVPNLGIAGTGAALKAGMTIAIEPMASLKRPQIKILDDGWTVVMRDGSLAAQFEHTVLITDGAAEILTAA